MFSLFLFDKCCLLCRSDISGLCILYVLENLEVISLGRDFRFIGDVFLCCDVVNLFLILWRVLCVLFRMLY